MAIEKNDIKRFRWWARGYLGALAGVDTQWARGQRRALGLAELALEAIERGDADDVLMEIGE